MSSYTVGGHFGGPLQEKWVGWGTMIYRELIGECEGRVRSRFMDSRDSLFFALPPPAQIASEVSFFPLYIFDAFFLLFQEGEKSETAP